MYRREHRNPLSFKDFCLSLDGQLFGDNRWIKLAELIPWDELEDDYAAQFCNGFGAPAKPFRMALGALIIKTRLKYTDEELVQQIKLSRPKRIHFSNSLLAGMAFSIQPHLIHQ